MMQGCQNSVCGWRKDETSIDSCGRAELRVNYAVSGVFCDITCTNSRKAGLLSDSRQFAKPESKEDPFPVESDGNMTRICGARLTNPTIKKSDE
jgi:hypothetical protein